MNLFNPCSFFLNLYHLCCAYVVPPIPIYVVQLIVTSL